MSCIKCKSSPCACNDHGLVTPCLYDDCDPGAEICEEIVCEECVRLCNDQDFRITDAGDADLDFPHVLLSVGNGESLAMTLQKIYLYIRDKDCAAEDNLEGHSPYYVYLNNITSNQITINWTGLSSFTTSVRVFQSDDNGLTWTASGVSILLPSLITSLDVGPLIPATDYWFKVVATMPANPGPGPDVECESVEVHTKTLI